MKILYLCHPDNYHIEKWVKGLTRKGVDIHLAGFQKFESPQVPYTAFPTLFDEIRFVDFLKFAPDIVALQKKVKADILFPSFAPTFGLATLMSGLQPYIIQTWSRDIGQDPNLTLREKWMVNNISYRVSQNAAGITTDGMAYKDIMLKKWPEFSPKTLGTPWGIDLSVFSYSNEKAQKFRKRWNIPAQANNLITSTRGVGSFYQAEESLAGIKKSAQTFKDSYFLILTLEHEQTAEVKSLLTELGEIKNVRIIDRLLSEAEMTEMWSATDFFISTPWFDGVSEGLSEGRAMKAIPLLNRLPSNLERANEKVHALYTPAEEITAQDIYDVIDRALTLSDVERASMLKTNEDWVAENADVSKTLDSLINLFEDVLRNHHG